MRGIATSSDAAAHIILLFSIRLSHFPICRRAAEISMALSMTTRSPDDPMTRSPDLFSDPTPLLREVQETERGYREVKQQLPEIERQFLEAKRRYRLFREIVLLRRELFIRRFKRLEDLARVRTVLRQQEGGQVQQNDPEADAERSRLAQNLKESFLKLE